MVRTTYKTAMPITGLRVPLLAIQVNPIISSKTRTSKARELSTTEVWGLSVPM